MNQNYRNPLIAKFFATDVAKIQRGAALEKLREGKSLFKKKDNPTKYIVRKNVQSEEGRTWISKQNFGNKRPVKVQLLDAQLKDFLENVNNGRSSVRIAEAEGRYIFSGEIQVLKDDEYNLTLKLKEKKKK